MGYFTISIRRLIIDTLLPDTDETVGLSIQAISESQYHSGSQYKDFYLLLVHFSQTLLSKVSVSVSVSGHFTGLGLGLGLGLAHI